MEMADKTGLRPIDTAVKHTNLPALQCFLRKGAKLSSTTWQLAIGHAEMTLALLNKLVDDGNLLYSRHKLADASHRFAYAMKKRALIDESNVTSGERTRIASVTYAIMLGACMCSRHVHSMLCRHCTLRTTPR